MIEQQNSCAGQVVVVLKELVVLELSDKGFSSSGGTFICLLLPDLPQYYVVP